MKALKNEIFVGSLPETGTPPDYYFVNKAILKVATVQSVALVGQELSIDEFNPVVADNYESTVSVRLFRSSDGKAIETSDGSLYAVDVSENTESDFVNVPYGTPMWYKHLGELVGKFYITQVKRQAKNKYQVNSVSAIGLLDKMYTGGGLFLASTFKTVLGFILAAGLHGEGEPVISYLIDDEVANLTVSGWIPYSTKRNALYQLIFSNGVNITKDVYGDPRFTFVYKADIDDEVEEVKSENIYNGGSIEYDKPYSRVEISEHTYTPDTSAESVTLFDNTDKSAVDHEEIWFDAAPVIVSTVAATGNLIIETDPVTGEPLVTENSAVVSGAGVLTGVPYTHTTKTVARNNAAAPEEKVVSVTDCTLVSLVNSDNLMSRLFAFYCQSGNIEKIKNSIVYSKERCGKAYRFADPFQKPVRDPETGKRIIQPNAVAYLASMEINASSFNKADCEWYANYEPAGQAGLYDVMVRMQPDKEQGIYSGTWTVPEGVTQFKVVLIGGGTGGTSGWPGANGEDTYTHTQVEEDADISGMWYGAEGGEGGEGGTGGRQGKVKVVTVENAVPGTVYSWTVGHGGEGGAATGFIPDTVDELRQAFENEDPDTEYTDAELQEIIDEYVAAYVAAGKPVFSGSINAGIDGTATSFGIDGGTVWSTDDQDVDDITSRAPVYDPRYNVYYNLPGGAGIKGGKGGARKVQSGGTFNWVTGGESVTGPYYHIEGEAELPEGEEAPASRVYSGGSTGNVLTSVSGLDEAVIKAYGGNGAGAAVGLDAKAVDEETGLPIYGHMHGGSNQSTEWWVSVDG